MRLSFLNQYNYFYINFFAKWLFPLVSTLYIAANYPLVIPSPWSFSFCFHFSSLKLKRIDAAFYVNMIPKTRSINVKYMCTSRTLYNINYRDSDVIWTTVQVAVKKINQRLLTTSAVIQIRLQVVQYEKHTARWSQIVFGFLTTSLFFSVMVKHTYMQYFWKKVRYVSMYQSFCYC